MKFKPITPDPKDVAFLRKKLTVLVRSMQADYERWLKPLIKRMSAEERKEAEERWEEAQAVLKQDAVQYLTAFEAARRIHTLKAAIVEACEGRQIEGAIQNEKGEWLIPEDKVIDYGVSIGKISRRRSTMEIFNDRLDRLMQKYEAMMQTYENASVEFLERTFKKAKKKFINQFKKEVGIDILKQLSEKGLREAFDAQVQENVNLIKTIPSNYFRRIQEMVVANALGQKKFEGGIVNAIQELTHTTRDRAKLIARDQTSKAVSTFTQMRYENLGCTKYIWHNSGDRRVAGNPNGLYPKPNPKSTAHGNHWEREGEVFEWKKPPPDGHPGMGINCRCFAEPIFDIEESAEENYWYRKEKEHYV